MDEIKDVKKSLNDFIKEIRDNYATKKELNDVKEEVAMNKEEETTKEVAKTNNK